MAVPDYQTLMLPLLTRLASAGEPVAVRTFLDSIANEFSLTPEERSERIPSGQENLLANRLAWARTYLGKAGLLVSPRRGVVAITDDGRKLLAENPKRIDLSVLKRYSQFAAWYSRSQSDEVSRETSRQTAKQENLKTPRERIDDAQGELEAALRADLLDRVRGMDPQDFEDLVIRLLLAMNYGQGLEEMAQALGGSGDGGVDGVIYQDPLGLERVYIQAKRWKEGNNVSAGEIRNFIGALNIKKASKGVFITASEFTPDAETTAEAASSRIVLIDGDQLSELMVQHKVGVLVRSTVEIKELDEGFFSG